MIDPENISWTMRLKLKEDESPKDDVAMSTQPSWERSEYEGISLTC